MPHPPAWANALVATATLVASWRWVLRPLVNFGRNVTALLVDIRTNASGIREVARDLHALAGSVVTMAVTMAGQHGELSENVKHNTDRLDGLSEVVIDLERDVRGVQRKLGLREPRR